MKEKLKEIWNKHKTKIIIGSVVVGGVVTYVVVRKVTGKKVLFVKKFENSNFRFDNIDDAVAKFKELGELCLEDGGDNPLGHEIVLFGRGGLLYNDGMKFVVMDLISKPTAAELGEIKRFLF